MLGANSHINYSSRMAQYLLRREMNKLGERSLPSEEMGLEMNSPKTKAEQKSTDIGCLHVRSFFSFIFAYQIASNEFKCCALSLVEIDVLCSRHWHDVYADNNFF